MITQNHELLERYLADLERRLAGAEPGERADILASVREHVESDLASLGRPATASDVAAALGRLGSVDAVAAAWSPETPAPVTSTRPPTSGLVVAAAVLAGLSLVLIALPPVGGAVGITALVLGVLALRRRLEPRWAAIVATVVGAVTVLVGLVATLAALFLFTARSEGGQAPDPVEVVVPAESAG